MSPRRRVFLFILSFISVLILLNFVSAKFALIRRIFLTRSYVFIVLFNMNLVLFILLLYLIGKNMLRLFAEGRVRSGRLRTKLLLSFFFVSIVPSVVVFFISAIFITKSLNYWFPVAGERTLKGALAVAQSYHRYMVRVVEEKSSKIKKLVASEGGAFSVKAVDLDVWRKWEGLDAICIVNRKGRLVGLSIDKKLRKKLAIPEKFRDGDLEIVLSKNAEWVWKVSSLGRGLYLLCGVFVPQNLSRWVESISNSYLAYKQLKRLRRPLRSTYVMILLVMTLLVVLASIWLSYKLSRFVVEPLERLTSSADRVGRGDFNVKVEVETPRNDEVGRLIDAFNWMVGELKKGRERIERDKEFMEAVLQNVPAGIVVMDEGLNIKVVNKHVEDMLGRDVASFIGKNIKEVIPDRYFSKVEDIVERARSGVRVRERVDVELSDRTLNLMVVMTAVRDYTGRLSFVAVLEDITESLMVQRLLAWREAARRVAHEIKNPLTPIKVSAERIRRRFLKEGGDEVLDAATRIIIDEVENIKALVQDFSQMAKFPSLNVERVDFVETIRGVVESFKDIYPDVSFSMDVRLGESAVVPHDRDQIRRVVSNLLKNAVEAVEGLDRKRVHVTVEKVGERVKVDISDTGTGIDSSFLSRVFDPYFSTKEKGRGLGLTIVSAIISEHKGRVYISRTSPEGTTITFEIPAS